MMRGNQAMSRRLTFGTVAALNKLPVETRQTEYRDAATPGMYARVSPGHWKKASRRRFRV